MVQYRRNRVPGGTYFFTVTLRDRRSDLLTTHAGLLRRALGGVQHAHPFTVDAIVVLPDHLHTVLTLPEGDTDYSNRWKAIKSTFSRGLRAACVPVCANAGGKHRVWQRRFWEHTIRDRADLQQHVDYIHWNPVKHGLVNRVIDWPYSSFHSYLRKGWVTPDWAGDSAATSEEGFGE